MSHCLRKLGVKSHCPHEVGGNVTLLGTDLGETLGMQPDEVPMIAAGDLPEDVVLLDVRGPEEWAAGHAPGALHVPADQLADRLAEVPSDREVVVVCHGGGRSTRSTALLNEHGYAGRKLIGGMPAWAAAGRLLVSENGQPPDVD